MNQPTILGIQTLVMMGTCLTNSGRLQDAWTLFGTTIRLAHSIGLHRHPTSLNHVPPLRECTIRQRLWWSMLHMDQQYSTILRRPLGISGIGDCPPPEVLTTDQRVVRLEGLATRLTMLARQILSSDDMMNGDVIDNFTDKLLTLWDTMPEALQFKESWTHPEVELLEWPLEITSASAYPPALSQTLMPHLLTSDSPLRTNPILHYTPQSQTCRKNYTLRSGVSATQQQEYQRHQRLHALHDRWWHPESSYPHLRPPTCSQKLHPNPSSLPVLLASQPRHTFMLDPRSASFQCRNDPHFRRLGI